MKLSIFEQILKQLPMKKTLFLLLLVYSSAAFGQNGDEDYRKRVKAFLGKTLHVVLSDDEKSEYNTSMKYALDKYWTATPLKYITEKEFEKLKSDENFYFLSTGTITTTTSYSNKAPVTVIQEMMRIGHYLKDGKEHEAIESMQINDLKYRLPLKYFMIIIAKHLQNKMWMALHCKGWREYHWKEQFEFSKKAVVDLQASTLYVSKADLNEKLTIEDIKKTYPGPVDVITEEELHKLIDSKDKEGNYFLVPKFPESKEGKNEVLGAPNDIRKLFNTYSANKYIFNIKTGAHMYIQSHMYTPSYPIDQVMKNDFKFIQKPKGGIVAKRPCEENYTK